MTTEKAIIGEVEGNWRLALSEAESRLAKIKREQAELLRAIRLMKRQIADGAPWPGGTEVADPGGVETA